VCLTAMGRADDGNSQGIVEHLTDHRVVADADPPRCLPDKLFRSVWPGIIDELFEGAEEPIADPPRERVDLAGRCRGEQDPIGHCAAPRRSSSRVARPPSSAAFASR